VTTHSSLARLQQLTTCAVAAAALGWLAWHLPQRPLLAASGALLICFGFSIVLAAEFLLLRLVGRNDPAPPPSLWQLLAAWWRETGWGLRIFYWRQPFRWRAEPDEFGPATHGKRGMVFVHGLVCNRGFWQPWLARVREQGHAFAAVNLEPVFASIDEYAPIVDAAVRRVAQATGMPPLLVCHSMGGLAARAWLRQAGAAAQVERVITIATPHQGTWMARFSRLRNGRQMRARSEWLQQLARDEARRTLPPFTCWYSNCDNIVFPASTATLAGADNRLVAGAAHVELAFRPEVVDATLAWLAR
jgi:predicted alpha/beta hydrolase family esterase